MHAAAVDALLEELLDAEPAPTSRRRTALLALAGLVTACALGAGGWYGTGWLRDGDLRAALTASTSGFEAVVSRAARVRTSADLALVAQEAALAGDRVGRARARVRDGGAAADELDAQHDVLAALAPLADLGRGPLQAWGRFREPFQAALDAEALTRRSLRRERPRDADRVGRAVSPLGPAVDRAVAPLLTRACTTELARVRAVLAGAASIADVRGAGEVAAKQTVAVQASASSSGGRPLERCAAVVGAVAGLDGLSGAAPEAWAAVRPVLVEALVAPDAVARVDAVLATAVQAQRDYQAVVAAAEGARQAEQAALTAHTGTVRGLTSGYGALDVRLTGLLDTLVARLVTPEDLVVLADDVAVRLRAAAGLAALVPPVALAPEHTALAQAAAAEAAAVQAVADALAVQAGLPPLPPAPPAPGVVAAAPLGQLVAQRVGATAARAAAATAWEAAAVRETALVEKRPLPEPPAA